MPIREYRCEACQKIIELIESYSQKTQECPDCKGPVEKLVSLSSFALKGTGWYVTDYKKKRPIH